MRQVRTEPGFAGMDKAHSHFTVKLHPDRRTGPKGRKSCGCRVTVREAAWVSLAQDSSPLGLFQGRAGMNGNFALSPKRGNWWGGVRCQDAAEAKP